MPFEKLQTLLGCTPNGVFKNKVFVIEIGGNVSGPTAGDDFVRDGALVIKLEGVSDPARSYLSKNNFTSLNAAKGSVKIDKNSPNDICFLHELFKLADVIIDNRSLLAQERDLELNSFLNNPNKTHAVIYCSIIGYDSQGYEYLPVFDVASQARMGMTSVNGPSRNFPLKIGFVVIDFVTGYLAASAIKSHLYALATGLQLKPEENYVIKIQQSLQSAAVSLLRGQILNQVAGKSEFREGNEDQFIAPFSIYSVKNGAIALAIISDCQFALFCDKVLRAPEFAKKYPNNKMRLDAREQFDQELTGYLAEKTMEEWEFLCEPYRIVCSRVNTIRDVIKEFGADILAKTPGGCTITKHSSRSSIYAQEQLLLDAPELDESRAALIEMIDFQRLSEEKTFHGICKSAEREKIFETAHNHFE